MLKPVCLIFSLLITPVAMALSIPNIQTPAWELPTLHDSALLKAGLHEEVDDLTDEQRHERVQLSTQQLHDAEIWGLTSDEEKRYVQLMKNRSNVYYEGLRMTPIDILGLNSQNDSERLHFAELAAKQEAIKVTQNLAWNNAFHEAYNKLFKGIPVVGDFDPAPFSPHAYKPLILSAGESLYLFIKDDDAIKTVLMILIEAIQASPNTQLNLLFLDMDEGAIQTWANRHEVPRALVHGKRITLNQGELAYEALSLKKKNTPLLLLAQDGAATPIDLGRF
jgi:integrating conjugative element protein (TIGR03759 family)